MIIELSIPLVIYLSIPLQPTPFNGSIDLCLSPNAHNNVEYIEEFFPGRFLVKGMSGNDVVRLQGFLYKICEATHEIPGVKDEQKIMMINQIFGGSSANL